MKLGDQMPNNCNFILHVGQVIIQFHLLNLPTSQKHTAYFLKSAIMVPDFTFNILKNSTTATTIK